MQLFIFLAIGTFIMLSIPLCQPCSQPRKLALQTIRMAPPMAVEVNGSKTTEDELREPNAGTIEDGGIHSKCHCSHAIWENFDTNNYTGDHERIKLVMIFYLYLK